MHGTSTSRNQVHAGDSREPITIAAEIEEGAKEWT